MQHIRDFKSYSSINEEENPSYSPLDAYRTVSIGVSRAFNLLSYFYAIAKPDADPSVWKAIMREIAGKKDYKEKWDSIISSAEEIQKQIASYAAKRRTEGVNTGRFFDVGVISEPIPEALNKFRTASDILTKQLSPAKISERLSLINRSLPAEPFKMTESKIYERSEKKRTPTESEVLNLADMLSASVTQALSLARNIKQLFPESKSFVDSTIKEYISPASEKINQALNMEVPDSDLQLSKSVRKSYEDKGWVLNSVQDKYLIDLYEDLIDLQDDIKVGMDKINQAKNSVVKELLPKSQAGEFVEAGNRILDSVESKIAEKEKIVELRRRANLMLPIAKDQPLPNASEQPQSKERVGGSGYTNPEELRSLLKKRVSR